MNKRIGSGTGLFNPLPFNFVDEDGKLLGIDGNVHVIPRRSNKAHYENKKCWCSPELIQDVDEEHDKQVWSHRGYEEVNQ